MFIEKHRHCCAILSVRPGVQTRSFPCDDVGGSTRHSCSGVVPAANDQYLCWFCFGVSCSALSVETALNITKSVAARTLHAVTLLWSCVFREAFSSTSLLLHHPQYRLLFSMVRVSGCVLLPVEPAAERLSAPLAIDQRHPPAHVIDG
jgi:hypothetical protein